MKEYGGYLPFELRQGREYYSGENVVALNLARNAVIYAVMDGKYTFLFICVLLLEMLLTNIK